MKRMIVNAAKVTASSSIPAPLDKYYDFLSIEDMINDGEMEPEDARDWDAEQQEMAKAYGGQIIGYGKAKDEYYDALADNGFDFVSILKEEDGSLTPGIFIHDRFSPLYEDEVLNYVGEEDF